ncbi:hypothetical protein L596_022079 [Steinernema carpocapsae]|uniref:Uncharacterized protein n=1 Tax=Steinernema carpocapsae TaxID=34508 RepID=A0A4U5MLI2_STECR|nr:hypothetical protein L596_022079 [Steinernema carpocapsae]
MKVSKKMEVSFVSLQPLFNTAKLTESQKKELAENAMAKSPNPGPSQREDMLRSLLTVNLNEMNQPTAYDYSQGTPAGNNLMSSPSYTSTQMPSPEGPLLSSSTSTVNVSIPEANAGSSLNSITALAPTSETSVTTSSGSTATSSGSTATTTTSEGSVTEIASTSSLSSCSTQLATTTTEASKTA